MVDARRPTQMGGATVNFNAETLCYIMGRHHASPPHVFFETGTQRGDTTAMVNGTGLFRLIITCERSAEFFRHARLRFELNPSVIALPLDSREALREHAPWEPCFFYLDAHHTKDGGSYDDFPLWDELAVLRERPFADIVVVDDLRGFGSSQWREQWQQVSERKIRDALGIARERATLALNDQFVIYRTEGRD